MVSNILIERPSGAAKVTISTARPGIVIGKKAKTLKITARTYQHHGCSSASKHQRN